MSTVCTSPHSAGDLTDESLWDAETRVDDPVPTYSHFVTQLRNRHPDLAYIHVVEPRIDGDKDSKLPPERASNDFLRTIWGDRIFISAGGHTRESGIRFANENGDLIAYGRLFISNVRMRTPHHLPSVKLKFCSMFPA